MPCSASLLFQLILLFVQNVKTAENGVVGFGISLYQDLCCQSCHDSLSSLYLSCTTFDDMSMDMSIDMDMDMDMSMMGTTSDECYTTNIPWLQTMAYCIQQNCNADGYDASKQAKCFSVQAVAGAAEPTFQESLPAIAPTVELSEDDMWINVTSLVNSNVYSSIHGTLKEFARSEYIHTRYSVTLYLIVIGVCFSCGLLAHTKLLFPGLQRILSNSTVWSKLQQHVFLPALLGARHLEPLPGNIGYVPGRSLSIFISVYVVLNVIFSSISFRNFWPNTWFASTQFEMCEYVGNRTGTLSLVNISIAILFAGRNNILIALTGWSQTTFLTFHRWAARVATVQAVVHSIVYTLAYFEPGRDGASDYAAQAALPFYYWGIIATIAICLATAFAVLPIRVRSYEFFLITHIALIILTLVGCWYHLVPHFGFVYGYQVWLYIAFAFWATDRVARVARILFYNRVGNSEATVEAIHGSDIMHVTVFPRSIVGFGPGQHSFLYFSGVSRFWQSHPFSVAAWGINGDLSQMALISSNIHGHSKEEKLQNSVVVSPGSDNESQQDSVSRRSRGTLNNSHIQKRSSIHFLIRAHSGITSTLQKRLLSTARSSMEITIYTEGPYAGHRATLQPLLTADTILCLVGGIGITNALGFIQEYTNSLQEGKTSGKGHGIMRKAKRFILAWSAREMTLIGYVQNNFLRKDDAEGVEYLLWCTQKAESSLQNLESNNIESQSPESLTPQGSAAVTAGKMDIGNVIRSSLERDQQMAVLVCGPAKMADEATGEVVGCVKDGFRIELIEEAFCW